MSVFIKLQTPVEGGTGWFVATVDGSYGWLTVNGIIETTTVPLDDYYFATELEAYEAAKTYYARHKMYYPHELELNALQYGIDAVEKIDTNESQVMEFI